MKYQTLYDLAMERGFVTVKMKNGTVVEDGWIYATSSWMQGVPLADTEGFDTVIDKFLEQKPMPFMYVFKKETVLVVGGARVGNKDFATGFTLGRSAKKMTSVTGKEIYLK